MTGDDATFLHGQREMKAHKADLLRTKLARFADNTPAPADLKHDLLTEARSREPDRVNFHDL